MLKKLVSRKLSKKIGLTLIDNPSQLLILKDFIYMVHI